jgi:hypothetical protein
MTKPTDPEAVLRRAIHKQHAVIVAGSGVSMLATGGAPHASWRGLVASGLERLRDLQLSDEALIEAQLSLIDAHHAQTHHFVSAAQDITVGLGGTDSIHYSGWLEETVGSLEVTKPAVLDALALLRESGLLVATTNYDSLLLGDQQSVAPVVWDQHDEFLDTFRNGETDRIMHLHGHWRSARSVVLDWSSYDRLSQDALHADDMHAFWRATPWVYVGCGVAGLSDPDLGMLLSRYGARFRNAGQWDFCLVTATQRDAFQAHFDSSRQNILAVVFGETYDDLPAFLASLAESPTSARRSRNGYAPLRAVPPYIGGHAFVGRAAELQTIDRWAADQHNDSLLLLEAIGGSGKSTLAWHWVNHRVKGSRAHWAGRFWYSFYEQGAAMADFYRHALAFMTDVAPSTFDSSPPLELASRLLEKLREQPWLFVLDGLERVLVAYHRVDAPHIRDDQIEGADDALLDRKPTATIHAEDDDLLRQLCAVLPSKVVITSRLTPMSLVNAAQQPIPGLRRVPLGGLEDADAEDLFRAAGASGDQGRIRQYLSANCANHPLVIGVLAGLVANYLPSRGNFDAWADDRGPDGGARLNLGALDLVQRRTHILLTAVEGLDEPSRELLCTLACCPNAIDYAMLLDLNPFRPGRPQPLLGDALSPAALAVHDTERYLKERWRLDTNRASHAEWEAEMALWRRDCADAVRLLNSAVKDLEQRGLLQYDAFTHRHDLHPVVRGVVFGMLGAADRNRVGQRVVDFFTAAPRPDYSDIATLSDVAPQLNLVQTLLRLGRYGEAAEGLFVPADLARALFDLEAGHELLAVVAPLFADDDADRGGPAVVPEVARRHFGELNLYMGLALSLLGRPSMHHQLAGLHLAIEAQNPESVAVFVHNIAVGQKSPSTAIRILELAARTAREGSNSGRWLASLYWWQLRLGLSQEAADTWERVSKMYVSPSVRAESLLKRAWGRYEVGETSEADLRQLETDLSGAVPRRARRRFHVLVGLHRVSEQRWEEASRSLSAAIEMSRERDIPDGSSEVALALCKYRLGLLSRDDAKGEALRLTGDADHAILAHLWFAIDERDHAVSEALRAYETARSIGDPCALKGWLHAATETLERFGVAVPSLPACQDEQDPFPWEPAVAVMAP